LRPDFIIPGGRLEIPAGYATTPFLGSYELMRLPGFAAQYKLCQPRIALSNNADSQMKTEFGPQTMTFWYYQRRI
jgi:hypothetical protein